MKKFIYTAILAMSAFMLQAQDIIKVFMDMPDELTGLDLTLREKLLEKQSDTIQVAVPNTFGGVVKRTDLSDDFIATETSANGTLQIKLLPLINDSKIVAVIRTVCAPVCDSSISFFSTSWQPINSQGLMPVITKDWLLKEGIDKNSDDFKNAFKGIDMNPVKLSLSPDNQTIIIESEIGKHINIDDLTLLEPYLSDTPKTLNWDKSSFK